VDRRCQALEDLIFIRFFNAEQPPQQPSEKFRGIEHQDFHFFRLLPLSPIAEIVDTQQCQKHADHQHDKSIRK
jgi:hypothetical protein